MTRWSHLAAWLLLCLAGLVVWPWWTGPERLAERAREEADATHRTFGPRTAAALLAAAGGAQVVFGHHGIDDLVRTGGAASHTEDPSDRYLSVVSRLVVSRAQRYLAALRLQFHASVLRALGMAAWCVLLLPVGVAAVVDGWVQRAVKVATFGYQNPAAFAVASHLFIASAMLPIAALVVPFPVPPLFMPLWLAAAMLPLRVAIAHMQPVFTR